MEPDESTDDGPALRLGELVGPFDARLDAALLRQWAAATKDPSSAVQDGTAVPAVAIVTQIWDAQTGGRTALVPDEFAALGGVHGEHDIVLHRPLAPGERLRIWVEGHGARPAGRNALVTLRYSAVDDAGELVAEQWWTTVYFGTGCRSVGDRPPDHTFPDGARGRSIGRYSIDVDAGMARRYAEVSGDWTDHHFDVEAAHRSGSDRPFLHGLCTMALCAQGMVDLVADGDASRVCRVAVRFSAPTFLGEQLVVHAYDAGSLGWAFEAESAGATVISHGRFELRR